MNEGIHPTKNYWVLDILDVASKETDEEGIRGSLKMEKISALVRENIGKSGYGKWNLVRNFRGPTDPGLTRLLHTYKDLDLIELKRRKEDTLTHKITEKGKKIKNSFERFFRNVDEDFENTKEKVDREVLRKHIEKSGNELVKMEEIQELKKEEPLGKKLEE